MGKITSPVWGYFEKVVAEPHLATCKLCGKNISRGSRDTNNLTTTNLKNHLSVHKDDFKKFKELEHCSKGKRFAEKGVNNGTLAKQTNGVSKADDQSENEPLNLPFILQNISIGIIQQKIGTTHSHRPG